jgi:hypothetical protein
VGQGLVAQLGQARSPVARIGQLVDQLGHDARAGPTARSRAAPGRRPLPHRA